RLGLVVDDHHFLHHQGEVGVVAKAYRAGRRPRRGRQRQEHPGQDESPEVKPAAGHATIQVGSRGLRTVGAPTHSVIPERLPPETWRGPRWRDYLYPQTKKARRREPTGCFIRRDQATARASGAAGSLAMNCFVSSTARSIAASDHCVRSAPWPAF